MSDQGKGAKALDVGVEAPAPAVTGTDVVRAPWSDDVVRALNDHQHDLARHPYTCPNGHELMASTDGWSCPWCEYRQAWAWGTSPVPESERRNPQGSTPSPSQVEAVRAIHQRKRQVRGPEPDVSESNPKAVTE